MFLAAAGAAAAAATSSSASEAVWAWGDNLLGEVGSGTSGNDANPGAVQGVGGAGSFLTGVPLPAAEPTVAAGPLHSLVVDPDGNVWAWGSDASGELGNGTTSSNATATPVEVLGGAQGGANLSHIISVAAGGAQGGTNSFSLALDASGNVWAWGDNTTYELGDPGLGAAANSSTPVEVAFAPGVKMVAIAAGEGFGIALDSAGHVWAWGDNTTDELGDPGLGAAANSSTPVEVGIPSGKDITAIAAGAGFGLALDNTGTVWAWGDNTEGQLGDGTSGNYNSTPANVLNQNLAPLTGIEAVAGGGLHGLALTTDGLVFAWGWGYYGQLGNGVTGNRSPVPLATQVLGAGGKGYLTDITQIAGGYVSSYALTGNGTEWAWGNGAYEQLGDGNFSNESSPVQATGMPTAISALAAGCCSLHALAALQAPSAVTLTGANLTTSTVTLTGTVNPNGAGVTDCHFEYGTTTSYGNRVACAQSPGSGTAPVSVTAAISLLAPNTTYHFRLVATSAAGTDYGADQTFTTSAIGVPAVTGVSPSSGPAAGGTNVTITGSGFLFAAAVTFGTKSVSAFTIGSDSQITTASPPGSGTVDVTVSSTAGTSATSASDRFTYMSAPVVTTVSPASGPQAGGTNVTITGSGFTATTAVDFGSSAASSFTVISDTQINAVSPAGSGTVDLTVTTPSGTSATGTTDRFTYVPASSGGSTTTTTTSTPGPPVVGGSQPPPVHSGTTEKFTAIVNPEGLPTNAYFQYGLQSGNQPVAAAVTYDHSTPSQFVGADFSQHTITATVTGLQPNSLYHYRLVTTNSSGTTFSADASFKSGPSPPPPPPVRGKTTNLAPVSGDVYVRIPHTNRFVLLTAAIQVTVGTTVNATHGTVTLVAARTLKRGGRQESARFHDGSFLIAQGRKAARVHLRLLGGAKCLKPKTHRHPAAAGAAAAAPHTGAAKSGPQKGAAHTHTPAPHKLVRKLWGSGHGDFTTQGANASASVQGTIWLTADYCNGTLVRVLRGVVAVRDFVHHRTVKVRAHHSYFAYRP